MSAIENILQAQGFRTISQQVPQDALQDIPLESLRNHVSTYSRSWGHNGLKKGDFSDVLAVSFVGVIDDVIGLANRFSGLLSKHLSPKFGLNMQDFLEHIRQLRRLRRAVQNWLESPITGVNFAGVEALLHLFPTIETDLRKELTPAIYDALEQASKETLKSADAVRLLSEAIKEIGEDYATILFGYWKASEIEGRQLIKNIVQLTGALKHKEGSLQRVAEVEKLTAGSVGFYLCKMKTPTESLESTLMHSRDWHDSCSFFMSTGC
ncbi:hypothetical protein FRD01_12925 [Microvenator marinus]|uniref:Uncharacterized protein n=1 Tax=Microvenator marinus TaxID=2600177 RepID=A0A5B8XSF2_9DELT|nr:hypothetical protein [Microvenator marinus]QED28117.1 hypothetical protein FRD01_12925 [Microvenator marinus]